MTQSAHRGKCKHIFSCLKVHTNSPAMKLLRTETSRAVMHQHYQQTSHPLELFRLWKLPILALFFPLIHLSVHKPESTGKLRNVALSSSTTVSCGCLPEFSAANTGAEVTLQPLHWWGRLLYSKHDKSTWSCDINYPRTGAISGQPFSLGQKFPSPAVPQTRLSLKYEPDIKITTVPNALLSYFC